MEKWAKDLNICFTEDIQLANQYIRRYCISFLELFKCLTGYYFY